MRPSVFLSMVLAVFLNTASGAAIPDQDTTAKSLVTRMPAPETMTRMNAVTAADPVATTSSTTVKPNKPTGTATAKEPIDNVPSWVLGDDPNNEKDDCEMTMHIGTVPWPKEEYADELPVMRVCVDDPESFAPGEEVTPETKKHFWHQKCRLAKTIAISPAKPGCKSYTRKVTVEKGIENDQDYLNGNFKPLWRPDPNDASITYWDRPALRT
ncbi:hypothetical protein LTR85_002269 [Meristemomyces frigidus]|nr:hypothetical protein LTR85_002269 [Meristemomyces frigidus]